ncbi:DciA family protein, partial [Streptomyces atratus]|uniref:DciA family protein n=1 Tax=Streptomyces atratus TaxID=1893 RepID=UPI00368FC672
PQLSGIDLARQALIAAREAARKSGSGQKTKKKKVRPVRTARRDGREPMGLGAAIGALVTERAWEIPAAGATLRERWLAIAPELAGHVAAVAFDADSGRLTVCPESSAWATKARLEQARVVEAVNKAAGRTVVRALRILPPGAVPLPDRADIAPAPAAPIPPVQRRTPPEGYRRALKAHREATPPRRVDPGIAEAVERQTAAMRELSRRAFPEPDVVPDDAPAPIEQARAQRRRQAAATEAAALRRARAERAGAPATPTRGRDPSAVPKDDRHCAWCGSASRPHRAHHPGASCRRDSPPSPGGAAGSGPAAAWDG